jgi:hypothetical protein
MLHDMKPEDRPQTMRDFLLDYGNELYGGQYSAREVIEKNKQLKGQVEELKEAIAALS